jgi:hypothetical protein
MSFDTAWEAPQPLAAYLQTFRPLIGDRRTANTFAAVVYGILAAGSTVCQRIARHSPQLATGSRGAQRVIRMVTGASTVRSQLDAPHLTAQLRQRAVEQLREEVAQRGELWLIMDCSDLRKPHALEMEHLQKVRALDGRLVNGYRTLTVLGLTPHQRGVLYQHLFSSRAPDFVSEPRETEMALTTVSSALAPLKPDASCTWIMDSGFDDVAVWRTVWEQQEHVVVRVAHSERKVRYLDRHEQWRSGSIAQAQSQLRKVATAHTELEIRLEGQPQAKRQRVEVVLSACPLQLKYRTNVRRVVGPGLGKEGKGGKEAAAIRQLWLVEVRIMDSDWEPWLLLTDWPVEQAAGAVRIFQMYRQRWAVEDSFKFTKECVDWEEVQLLDLEAIRTLVALAWVAAGFLYELGVTWEWEEVQLLAKLGGFEPHKDRKPGKIVLTRGLQRLMERMVTEAVLQDYFARHGKFPPRIAQFLGDWPPQEEL